MYRYTERYEPQKSNVFLSSERELRAAHHTVPLVAAPHSGLLGLLSVEKLLPLTLSTIATFVTVEN